jgi:dipeptidyl aminopeptidase/acylaminoacyl peptidase
MMRQRSLARTPAVVCSLALLSTLVAPIAAQTPRAETRAVRLDDLDRLKDVRDPQISPEGRWIAYTVSSVDLAKDRDNVDIWMSSWDGREHIQLTSTPDRESRPRFSPDGKYLAFLSGRQQGEEGEKKSGAQLWLLNRQGGEAVRITELKGGVSDYEWAPDSTRLVLVVSDPDESDEESADKPAPDKPAPDKPGADKPAATSPDKPKKPKTPKPIVIDRYTFKRDIEGYLGKQRSHLSLLTLATRKVDVLTSGVYDETLPSWSPDGQRIAFVSKRGPDPDRTNDGNVFVMDAKPGAEARQLTTFAGPDDDARPAWSPDGSTIAYLQGSEPRLFAYNLNQLAVVPSAGGTPRILTASLDRAVSAPKWTPDGSALLFVIEDDRAQHLGRLKVGAGSIASGPNPSGPAPTGAVERLVSGRRVLNEFSVSREGRIAALSSVPTEPSEVHVLDGTSLRKVSAQNADLLAELRLGITEDATFTAKDGTKVNGVVVKPADYQAGRRYPLLLVIHGGPNGQDEQEFTFQRELFAAHGYVVLAVNYRGSSGRGHAYQTAIYADWGHKEVVDLLAGVDGLIAQGIADPNRLGIGGWSYGGILTNYTIATDPRFKAATSGAGSSLQTSMYGTDQYIFQYDTEMGRPWKSPDVWMKVSYPFFKADRIKTPTLFMGGEKDFNVPIAGSEQMYQALRSEGVDTQLVVYPGQFHGLTIPSYRKDRLQRYLDWYGRYLKADAPAPTSASK